jgi:hypothetical protein
MVPNIPTTVHDPMLGWVREERLLYSFPVSRQSLAAGRAGSAVSRGDMLHSVWSRAPLARANTGSWWVIFGERRWVNSLERRSQPSREYVPRGHAGQTERPPSGAQRRSSPRLARNLVLGAATMGLTLLGGWLLPM